MSRKAMRESIGVLAVVGSLVFVGLEIRASNVQARAAAYQAFGIAQAEWLLQFDDRLNRLYDEANYPEAVAKWSLADWDRVYRPYVSSFRLYEAVLLQIEQGLLPPDAMDRLGFAWRGGLGNHAMACLWPRIAPSMSAQVRSRFEAQTPAEDRVECVVDLQALRDRTVLGDPTG